MILDLQIYIYLVIQKNAKRYLIFYSRNLKKTVPPVKFTKYELLQFCVKVTTNVLDKNTNIGHV